MILGWNGFSSFLRLQGSHQIVRSFSNSGPTDIDQNAARTLEREIRSVLTGFKELQEIHAPSRVVGKSGVEHTFTFSAGPSANPTIVGDVVLGSGDKDETKVLSLFIRVYDVGVKRSILCVSPRLTPEASRLARVYNILTVESPDPKLLPRMLQDLLRRVTKQR